MLERNVKFVDLYKSVDRFIRDAYTSSEGVSEYLRQMEQNEFKGALHVSSWKTDYDRLKHLRWIRNQLSHEVGFDSDLCGIDDYNWLLSFRDRLYSADDPLARLNKAEAANRQRPAVKPAVKPALVYQKPRKSFWQKFRDFFLGKR